MRDGFITNLLEIYYNKLKRKKSRSRTIFYFDIKAQHS